MKQYEFSAKNVQEAINKGLKELDKKLEDVDIKVLAEGGFFSKAKIIIITEEEEPITKTTITKASKEEFEKEPKAKNKEDSQKKEKTPKTDNIKQAKNKETLVTKVKPETQKTSTSPDSDITSPGIEFIKELSQKLGVDATIDQTQEEENILITLNAKGAGILIGYRGEGLSAIQYLANVIHSSSLPSSKKSRIVLDIENYKKKREEALIKLANKVAQKVLETGKSQRLEPMNAYERRVIHAALSDKNLKTHSKGYEPKRYIVIEPIK